MAKEKDFKKAVESALNLLDYLMKDYSKSISPKTKYQTLLNNIKQEGIKIIEEFTGIQVDIYIFNILLLFFLRYLKIGYYI